MSPTPPDQLKDQVRAFWNVQSCDSQAATAQKFSRDYFEEIEAFRYFDQPFIHAFAQFSRYRNKKVLEVGFGAGTDFIQWLRAGAMVSGVDLTPEALENVRHRIAAYALPAPEEIRVADAENLPFATNTFDLGYSFGVLHHTPDTGRALRELVRVVKPGGQIKVMLYNRRSIRVFNDWVKHALLKGRPWKSLTWVAANVIESTGTKAYTRKELAALLPALGLNHIHVRTEITSSDYLGASALPPLNWLYRAAIRLAGEAQPWRVEHYTSRPNDTHERMQKASRQGVVGIEFSGNPRGFFHCITAAKV
jgi:ubiquinone/menaquinone biosynthesis C-methylase UbiE